MIVLPRDESDGSDARLFQHFQQHIAKVGKGRPWHAKGAPWHAFRPDTVLYFNGSAVVQKRQLDVHYFFAIESSGAAAGICERSDSCRFDSVPVDYLLLPRPIFLRYG